MTGTEWPKPGDVVAVRGTYRRRLPQDGREEPKNPHQLSVGRVGFEVYIYDDELTPWRSAEEVRTAEARVRELEAALRELRDQHVSDPADVPNVYDFDDDAYCEALESALRRADALLAAPTHGGRGSGEQP